MKTILLVASLLININAYAFTQNAALDFTNLYGNTNAGVYEISVTFISKTTPSNSELTFSNHRDDNYLYCVTKAEFEMGKMIFTMTSKDSDWTFTTTKPVIADISHQSEDENCMTDLTKFTGEQRLYSALGLKQIELPTKAPFEYEKVYAFITPFNGYLYLSADVKLVDGQLVADPSHSLSEKSITSLNKNNAAVSYYVYATKDSTSLSLGTGLVKF